MSLLQELFPPSSPLMVKKNGCEKILRDLSRSGLRFLWKGYTIWDSSLRNGVYFTNFIKTWPCKCFAVTPFVAFEEANHPCGKRPQYLYSKYLRVRLIFFKLTYSDFRFISWVFAVRDSAIRLLPSPWLIILIYFIHLYLY